MKTLDLIKCLAKKCETMGVFEYEIGDDFLNLMFRAKGSTHLPKGVYLYSYEKLETGVADYI